MTTLSIVYHPAWEGAMSSEPEPTPLSSLSLALALALVIAGLAVNHLTSVTIGGSVASIALLPTVVGLWIAISVGLCELPRSMKP